jgi:hypothetical protein
MVRVRVRFPPIKIRPTYVGSPKLCGISDNAYRLERSAVFEVSKVKWWLSQSIFNHMEMEYRSSDFNRRFIQTIPTSRRQTTGIGSVASCTVMAARKSIGG